MEFLFNHRIPAAVLLQVALEAVLFSFAIVVAVQLSSSDGVESPSIILLLAVMLASVIVLINLGRGLHRRDLSRNATRFATSKTFALVVALPIAYVAIYLVPHGNLLEDARAQSLLVAITGFVLVRGIFVFSSIRADLLTYRVLIVGAGRDACAVEAALNKAKAAGILVVAFYPLSRSDNTMVTPERIIPFGTSLADAARKLRINEIVIATREQRGGTLPLRHLVDCRLEGIRVTCLPSFFERFRGEIPIDSLKAGWLIYSDGFRQGWGRSFVKRTFDLIASSLLLLVAAPIMLATAIAILIESGTPVIYRQERVGLRGKSFRLLKFRSMTADAERDGIPRWASSGDSRVTAVGHFIRRTRIDELPQIFNVFKGDMSFVGPRPERPVFVTQLTEQIPFYRARLSVKPGITGWAQIRFSYGASVEDATKKLQYDLYYVKNHTLLLDLVIVLRTVRVVLNGEGAR
jgi:sugar transferase (PEP-CTERM system associated)